MAITIAAWGPVLSGRSARRMARPIPAWGPVFGCRSARRMARPIAAWRTDTCIDMQCIELM